MNFNNKEKFVKMYTSTVYKLSQILSAVEFKAIMNLANYVAYETCILKSGWGKHEHNMSLKEISVVLGLDYSRCTRIINSLIQKGVIGLFKTGNPDTGKIEKYYIVNPYIYTNGKNPEKAIVEFFDKSNWKEILN